MAIAIKIFLPQILWFNMATVHNTGNYRTEEVISQESQTLVETLRSSYSQLGNSYYRPESALHSTLTLGLGYLRVILIL